MEVRIVGAHQGDWTGGDFTSFLVDGWLAVDAGAIASRLTLAEQEGIRDILITHRHFDHLKDLPSFGFNMMLRTMVTLHAIPDVRTALEATLLNPDIWLDFLRGNDRLKPSMRFAEVTPGQRFEVNGYTILPIATSHTVPTVGYQITGPNGGTFYYTGDNGPGASQHWVAATPDVLATEVTFSNRAPDAARSAAHLTPAFLADELRNFKSVKGYVPRVVAVHLNPDFEDEIAVELAELARQLGVSIEIGAEGMRLDI